MDYQCKTPILIIGFNRPDYMAQTFEQVRKVHPNKLYLAVDGPRPDRKDDLEAVLKVHDFVNKVDWPCDVQTNFRKQNVGCGYGPANAISWAFETTEELIILEDDCVADLSFFRYCDELLDRYRYDSRIWVISGRGHHPDFYFFKNYDYIFSNYSHTWGWATWKRCWKEFDIEVKDFKEYLSLGGALNILASEKQGRFYNYLYQNKFGDVKKEVSHSWDSQWVYARHKNHGLGIAPAVNLVRNVGEIGTHSKKKSSVQDLYACEMSFPLRHPKFVMPLKEYEDLHFEKHILKSHSILYIKIRKKLINFVRRIF